MLNKNRIFFLFFLFIITHSCLEKCLTIEVIDDIRRRYILRMSKSLSSNACCCSENASCCSMKALFQALRLKFGRTVCQTVFSFLLSVK